MDVETVAAGAALVGLGLVNIVSIVRARSAERLFFGVAARLRGRSRERAQRARTLRRGLDEDRQKMAARPRPVVVLERRAASEFVAGWDKRRREELKAAKLARHEEAERAREEERRRREEQAAVRKGVRS